MQSNKKCVCLDEDEYSCYYLRLKKKSKSKAEKLLETGDDTDYCWCKCHAEHYLKAGQLKDMADVFFTEWMTKSRF